MDGSQKQQAEEIEVDPPIEHDLKIHVATGSQYVGCTEKMTISKMVVQPGGRGENPAYQRQAEFESGYEDNTPHSVFKLEGSNLRYTAKISPKEELCATCHLNDDQGWSGSMMKGYFGDATE